MSEVKSYVLVLKYGEIEDKMIRNISLEGGQGIMEILKNNPPQFIEVKGRMIATNAISQLVPVNV
jgi:predicted ATP-grasp superfamily ATP-dependent carboligase